MQCIGIEAIRLGFSMQGFARVVGIDLRVLQRYFLSALPGVKTLGRLTAALGWPPIVTRALIVKDGAKLLLKDEDFHQEKLRFIDDLFYQGFPVFGPNIIQLNDDIDAMFGAKPEVYVSTMAVSICARYGLWPLLELWGHITLPDPVLGRYLRVIGHELSSGGVDIHAYFWKSEEEIVAEKQSELSHVRNSIRAFGLHASDFASINAVLSQVEEELASPIEYRPPHERRALSRKRAELAASVERTLLKERQMELSVEKARKIGFSVEKARQWDHVAESKPDVRAKP